MTQIPTLTTERLTLRAPELSDFDAYAAFSASDRAKGIGGPYTRSQAFGRLCEVAGHWQLRGYGRWVIADTATNTPQGIVGLMFPLDWPEPEIAWSVFASAEGKGYAFEAALASRDYAYQVLGWDSVISCVMPDNPRSAALAVRLGATHESQFDHPLLGELHIYRHPNREVLQ